MKDGVYQVHVGGACAGFVIRDGKLAECAPILRRTFHHWQRVAHYLGAELLKTSTIESVSISAERIGSDLQSGKAQGSGERAE